jgi:ATP-dependent DNA ligase
MMANNAESNRSEFYLTSDEWWAERKYDGVRYMVHIEDGEITALRGRDSSRTILPPRLAAEFRAFTTGTWVWDGEMIGDTLVVFDLPVAGTHIGLNTPYRTRRKALEVFFAKWAPSDCIQLSVCAKDEADKRALLDEMLAKDCEGVMFKKLDGTYRPGRRVDIMRKHKFVKTVDAIVTRMHVDGKDNCAYGVFKDGKIVEIGKSSIIGKRGNDLKVGDVIEVKFLYCVNPDKPRLVQPRLIRQRTDKSPLECMIAQLDGTFTNKQVAV